MTSQGTLDIIIPQLLSNARKWATMDPNPITSTYVLGLIENVESHRDGSEISLQQLQDFFPRDGSRIDFGTAGLRAAMKPGPLGMNDLVIVQTTQGLARYCQQQQNEPNRTTPKLLAIVGYDHRSNREWNLSSRGFAHLTQQVFQQAGMDCILLDGFVPTPLVAFSTIYRQAAVGVMITASHNPRADNGYKVYWKDGCQIRPPLDREIKAFIEQEQNLTPWISYSRDMMNAPSLDKSDSSCPRFEHAGTTTEELANAYFLAISNSGIVTGQGIKLSSWLNDPPISSWTVQQARIPRIAYSAMHGVGYPWAVKAMNTFHLPPFRSVPLQQEPDPAFPTVSFPNPEEKGALQIAMQFADENDCCIIVANDPDADRLALAEKQYRTNHSDATTTTAPWITFTGDQIGTMLGHWIWDQIGRYSDKPVAMCASTASSKMLATIAQVEGFHFEDTLTGFKWIGHRAHELRTKHGYRSLFAYEEAIGFCCGDIISDKDGLTALGVCSELIYHVYHEGNTLSKYLQSLYDKYGEFCSNNGYFYCYEPSIIHHVFDTIRNGGNYMSFVGPYEVESIRDLGFPGYDSKTPDKKPTLPVSKSSPMITIRFVNGCVVQFRGSGTEPKFKYYIEMRGQPGLCRDSVEQELKIMSEIVLELLLHPIENGLVRP